jgi:hypothetical protein
LHTYQNYVSTKTIDITLPQLRQLPLKSIFTKYRFGTLSIERNAIMLGNFKIARTVLLYCHQDFSEFISPSSNYEEALPAQFWIPKSTQGLPNTITLNPNVQCFAIIFTANQLRIFTYPFQRSARFTLLRGPPKRLLHLASRELSLYQSLHFSAKFRN